ncbi:hypothetical protein [Flavobacterium sp.]|jgi:hypothetical protein|uniref:hypothetical protein n=1 Tax=Flavobacterium sp. TaxID=239 RepID=UPI0037C1AA71
MATGVKTGGRQKGTPNRTTSEAKQVLQNIVNKELENITTLLDKLEPKERIDSIIKLLPYIVPKQQEIAIENKESEFKNITITIVPPTDDN